MKSPNQLSSRVTLVSPVARGEGSSGEAKPDAVSDGDFLSKVMTRYRSDENLGHLTSRIELFVSDVVYQIDLMRSALERHNLPTIDVVAKKLAIRCDDVGASRMMQLCIKIHMTAFKGDSTHLLESMLDSLERQFAEIKDRLLTTRRLEKLTASAQ